MQINEKQLAQGVGTTTAATLFTPTRTSVIKSVVICNTSTSQQKFRIFIDADGTTYDKTTAMFYDTTIEANTFVEVSTYWAIEVGGNLGIEASDDNVLTFTLSGAEIK